MKINKVIRLIPTKENNFAKLDKSITLDSGIYFLYDSKLKLIYIGRSKNIRQRILQHVSEGTTNRYVAGQEYLSLFYSSKLPIGIVKYFSFIKIKREDERRLKEILLINIFKPRYNSV